VIDLAIGRFLSVTREQRKAYEATAGDLFYELEQDFKERTELGVAMLKHYASWAPRADKFTPIAVEYDFEVPIQDPVGRQLYCKCHDWPVLYQGRIDGVVRDEFRYNWILEHKTAAQLGSTNHLALDEQCGSYAWALSILGYPVKGVIYNEALKDYPTPPERLASSREGRNFSVNKRQRTTYDIYLNTLVQAGEDIRLYAEMLAYLKENENPFFRRTQVHRNAQELRDIGYRIYLEAQDILDPELRIYPNPTRINCQGCAFREPCIMMNEGGDYEFLLNELYYQRPESGQDTGSNGTELGTKTE
jgi:hypothetical protein